MHRRSVLVAVGGGLGLGGCLSRDDDAGGRPATIRPLEDDSDVATATGEGVTARFRVVGGHAPTDDAASATFDGQQMAVSGTMDPSDCNRPSLSSVRYERTAKTVHLRIGGESPYGTDATVECDNASYDFRCVLAVDRGQPAAVEVVYDYRGKADREFTLERE